MSRTLLEHAVLEHLKGQPVSIYLIGGRELQGHLTDFDDRCLRIDQGAGSYYLVFAHAMAALGPAPDLQRPTL